MTKEEILGVAAITIVQNNPKLFHVSENLENSLELIKGVKSNVILFPELAFTGYAFTDRKELEGICESPLEGRGKVFSYFRQYCVDNNVNVAYGFVEKYKDLFFNSMIFVRSNGEFELYRKTHLFCREKLFFSPGDTGFKIIEENNVKYGLAICFDWMFPESFRTLSLMGADIILHAANLVLPYCQEANRLRSLENRVFIATANRCGHENNREISYDFTGMSQLTAPNGEVVKRFSTDNCEAVTIDIDEKDSRNKKINPFNDLFKDRVRKFYHL
jgi:predicted amidohydrolase